MKIAMSIGVTLSLLVLPVLAQEVDVPVQKTEKAAPQTIKLARGKLTVTVPGEWKVKPSRSRIVEKELAIPPVKGDENPGRLTMMSAFGSVQANVDRWMGQFSQPDGKPTAERTKVVDRKIDGQDVKIVTITGEFKESIGPPRLGNVKLRPDYRMLGAIVQTKESGQYFFKAYGPDKTMSAAEKSFMKMIESISTP